MVRAMRATKKLRVLLFKEDGWWVAQCLEHDIAAQAKTLAAVEFEIQRLIVLQLFASAHEGARPIAEIPPAPERFHRLYEDEAERIELTRVPKLRSAAPMTVRRTKAAPSFEARVC